MSKYSKEVEILNINTVKSYLKIMPDFCSSFINGVSGNLQHRTRKAYCVDLFHFLSFLKNNNPFYKNCDVKDLPFDLLEKLSAEDLDEYLAYLDHYESNGKTFSNSNAAKARKLSTINKMYKFFIKRGYLKNNPASVVERPSINKKDIVKLERDEVKALISLIQNPEYEEKHKQKLHKKTVERDLAIILVFLGTGIRVSELVGLNINDVNFGERALRITRKGGDVGFVYFSDDVLKALCDYLGYKITSNGKIVTLPSSPRELLTIDKRNKEKPNTDKDALFLSLRGSRLTVRSVEVLVRKYTERLGLDIGPITPHKLRSTYGTEFYNKTGDIYLTAEALGHKDVNTTKSYYAEVDKNRLKAANSNLWGFDTNEK